MRLVEQAARNPTARKPDPTGMDVPSVRLQWQRLNWRVRLRVRLGAARRVGARLFTSGTASHPPPPRAEEEECLRTPSPSELSQLRPSGAVHPPAIPAWRILAGLWFQLHGQRQFP